LKKYLAKISNEMLLVFSILMSLLCKYIDVTLPIIGDLSVVVFAITYFYSGVLFKKYEYLISYSYFTILTTFMFLLFGCYFYCGNVDMRFTTLQNLMPFYLLSISGVVLVFAISSKLFNLLKNGLMFYIGNHTMPILALNLLALKFGNLLKISYYNLPIEELSSHTVIAYNNEYFWLIYSIIGVVIPLLLFYVYSKIVERWKDLSRS